MDAIPAARDSSLPPSIDYAPAILALGAPVSVIVALEVTGQVLLAFLAYHVVFCLALPLAVLGVGGHDLPSIGDHLALRPPSTEGWAVGLVAGFAGAAAILVPFASVGEALLAGVDVGAQLASWGLPAGVEIPLFAYMLVFNSGAEELFWRGYLHTEATRRLGVWVGIPLVALAFASYHFYTLASLLGDAWIALAAAAGILAGAILWAWLRERYESVVPALLAHAGATTGYMTVFVLLV